MTTNSNDPTTSIRASALRWPFTEYMSRMFMMPPTVIFTIISLRFLTNPTHAISPTGLAYSQPDAITDTRVIGAVFLALAVLVLGVVLSKNLLRQGHVILIVVLGLVLAVRLYGFATDGTSIMMGDEWVKTFGEIIFLTLNMVGLVVQTIRRRRAP
ncbi:MAG TPA: DUF4345 family protein [Candidatus Acidoferrum sp.]|nr:DUF4345 family protein [Candidatus Acidoferrum sp.]